MNQKAEKPVEDITVVEPAVLTQLEHGQLMAQVEVARMYPRSVERFRNELLTLATVDEETAASCHYAIPRAGKTIEGPSIRFAEMGAYSWGNCRVEARLVEVGADTVRAQGTFFDCERNVGVRIEISRRIIDSKGRRYNADMIAVTSNAAIAIARRDAILAGVPKSYFNTLSNQVKQVALGDVKTLPQKRTDALEYFHRFGITDQQIIDHLKRKHVEDITLEDVALLRAYANAIKDEDSTPDSIFGEPKSQVEAKSDADLKAFDEATGGSGESDTEQAGGAEKPQQEEAPKQQDQSAGSASLQQPELW